MDADTLSRIPCDMICENSEMLDTPVVKAILSWASFEIPKVGPYFFNPYRDPGVQTVMAKKLHIADPRILEYMIGKKSNFLTMSLVLSMNW